VTSNQVWGLAKTDEEWSTALEAALMATRQHDLEHGTNAAYVAGRVCKECRVRAPLRFSPPRYLERRCEPRRWRPVAERLRDEGDEADDRRGRGKDQRTGQPGSELRTPFLQPGGAACQRPDSPPSQCPMGRVRLAATRTWTLDSRFSTLGCTWADLRLAAGDRCSAVMSPRCFRRIERPPGRTQTT
jgi:hypothetical protein